MAWPVSLAPGLILSSPVLDSATGRVFVGSGFNGTTGGQLFAVTAATDSVFQTSPQLALGNGIASAPIVDSTAGLVYVFVATDTGGVACLPGGHTGCTAIYQLSTNLISSGGSETAVGYASPVAGFPFYPGTFDNAYYTSANATGFLYACGRWSNGTTLFKVAIVSGFMSPSLTNEGAIAGFGGASIPCSSVTEVFNPNQNSGIESGGPSGTDKIFLSTQGTDTCSPWSRANNGGCLWALPATSWQPGTAYQVGQVIVDDGRGMCIQIVTTAGTSSVTTEPNWGVNSGVPTTDGTVTWTCKVTLTSVISCGTWVQVAGLLTGAGECIVDTNGNIEAATVDFVRTGATQPTWPLNIGAQTMSGSQIWVNVGPVDVFSLQVGGGTSGIVVDNTVLPGTLAGASQIYFSPLGTGFGTCGAGNGCAVQDSQAGLN